MEAAEKMVALKRAYAEIILNTAKEAAARILVSEHKAVRFQQDLWNAKEEALRMLLRMKQMMDSKTTEAETKSYKQQERIEVLEAQLEEAEEIIVNLREELQQAYDALEKAKSDRLLNLTGGLKDDASLAKCVTHIGKLINTSERIIHYPLHSESKGVTNSQKDILLNNEFQDCDDSNIAKQAEQVDVSDSGKFCSQDSDFTSILMRTKEPELYKNGCTHRIRAAERDLVSGTLDVSGERNNEFVVDANEKREGKCLVPCNTKDMEVMKKSSRVGCKKPNKVHSLRRKARFVKVKGASHRSQSGHIMNSCQRSTVISNSKTHLSNGNARPVEDAPTIPACKTDELKIEKNIHACYLDGTRISYLRLCSSGNSFVLTPCKTNQVTSDGKCGEEKSSISEEEPKVDSPLPDPGLTLQSQIDLESANGAKEVKLLDQSGAVSTAEDKETAATDESLVTRQENDAAESLLVPSCESNPNVFDVPPTNDATNDANLTEVRRSPRHGDGMRIFKFTFQRKRKKEHVSNYLGTRNVKRRAVQNNSDAEEPQNTNSINESPCDSQRVAQVAQQLISLSGK